MITLQELKQVNKEYRQNDESHLWPIRGKFNVAERAIRRARSLMRDGLVVECDLEYDSLLDLIVSEIVNDESNW